MNPKYKRPAVASAYRILALLCLAVGGAGLVVAISTNGEGGAEIVGPALGGGLALWAISSLLDYAARGAYHAERTADSLERMEWAAGEPARRAEQAQAAAEHACEMARWQKAQAEADA